MELSIKLLFLAPIQLQNRFICLLPTQASPIEQRFTTNATLPPQVKLRLFLFTVTWDIKIGEHGTAWPIPLS